MAYYFEKGRDNGYTLSAFVSCSAIRLKHAFIALVRSGEIQLLLQNPRATTYAQRSDSTKETGPHT